MSVLVLLRHGESAWNAANVFTGWIDVGLSEHGEKQAQQAGALLAAGGYFPEVVHTPASHRLPSGPAVENEQEGPSGARWQHRPGRVRVQAAGTERPGRRCARHLAGPLHRSSAVVLHLPAGFYATWSHVSAPGYLRAVDGSDVAGVGKHHARGGLPHSSRPAAVGEFLRRGGSNGRQELSPIGGWSRSAGPSPRRGDRAWLTRSPPRHWRRARRSRRRRPPA